MVLCYCLEEIHFSRCGEHVNDKALSEGGREGEGTGGRRNGRERGRGGEGTGGRGDGRERGRGGEGTGGRGDGGRGDGGRGDWGERGREGERGRKGEGTRGRGGRERYTVSVCIYIVSTTGLYVHVVSVVSSGLN